MSVAYSFTNGTALDKVPQFIAWPTIGIIHGRSDMAHAFVFTIAFTALMVLLTNVVAMLLAVVLDGGIKGRNVLRAAFYLPNIISLIIIGYVWRFIFSKGFDSFLNATHAGIFGLSWLGDGKLAFFSVLAVSVWQSIGFYLVIYIAGLQTVPRDIIEASLLDGVGAGRGSGALPCP